MSKKRTTLIQPDAVMVSPSRVEVTFRLQDQNFIIRAPYLRAVTTFESAVRDATANFYRGTSGCDMGSVEFEGAAMEFAAAVTTIVEEEGE